MSEEKQVSYAFNWLSSFGKVQLEDFEAQRLPQKYQSAWTGAIEQEPIAGVGYKPLKALGVQDVKGRNYYILAEQTLTTNPPIRRVVRVTINEFEDNYELVDVVEVLG